ncbi:MAG: hypothetical protein ACQCN3_02455 [Candidatus Bathyarchaeia archaeon]|jgi:hypothetical protein
MVSIYDGIAIAFVIAVIAFVSLYVFIILKRRQSKPSDGVQLGYWKINGYNEDGSVFTPFEGRLAEVTKWLLVPDAIKAFETIVIPGIKQRIDMMKEGDEKTNLEGAINALLRFMLDKRCHLYLMKTKDDQKELFVHYGNKKEELPSLLDYASSANESTESIALGPQTEHFLNGRLDSLPGEFPCFGDYKQFGPFQVHMFIPYERGKMKLTDTQEEERKQQILDLKGLGQVMGFLPAALNFENVLKVKNDKIKSLNIENRDLRRDIQMANTELGIARRIIDRFSPEGRNSKALINPSKFNIFDVTVQLMCTLLCGALFGFLAGPTLGVPVALVGVVIGYGIASLITYWRG